MMPVEEVAALTCSMNGHLRERPLAELIREITAAKLSGALRLARERVQAVVYAEAGEIVFARSNLRMHRLAICLQRWGALPEDKLAALVTEMMSDAEACAALTASGALSKDALSKLLARQATDVLRPLLLWTEGTWSFDARARLAEDVRCKLELRQLLLEAARQLPAEFVATRLADDAEVISPVKELPADLQLQALEGFILSRVETPLALGDLISVSGLPDDQTRSSVYTLALGGFLARAAWPVALSTQSPAQTPATGKVAAPEAAPKPVAEEAKAEPESAAVAPDATRDPRSEIDALFALVYDADYYQILGVERAADSAECKRAYYALAKRFHPDRFQRDADDALRPQVEAAFMKITQAYETLRDPRARAAYELKLGTQIGTPGSAQSSGRAGASSSSSANLSREQRAAESFAQGLAALKQNNLSSAVTLLGEAARLVPQQARYHAFYGSALARDVRTRHQAEAELQTAIKLDANDPAYRVMLAELLRALGQLRRAERELERALSLDPNHDAARRMLNQIRKSDK
ncbi:MAG TPA: DnaJ domain-containing protein [Pyrinomonadaceae bacterium]|nr:DnaJ domain-containing protein [Pyrinomonadaceae bacterium]